MNANTDPITISGDTFNLLLGSMLTAMDTIDRNSQVPGYDLLLAPALDSALKGDREAVLRDVAEALSPLSPDVEVKSD